jgi:hypothetical protein
LRLLVEPWTDVRDLPFITDLDRARVVRHFEKPDALADEFIEVSASDYSGGIAVVHGLVRDDAAKDVDGVTLSESV